MARERYKRKHKVGYGAGKGAIVCGADGILDYEGDRLGALAIVDHKTGVDDGRDELYAFQLAIYVAGGRGEGIEVRAAHLHDLGERAGLPVSVDSSAAHAVRPRAAALVQGIADRHFTARQYRHEWSGCDIRFVCRHGPAR